MSAAHTPGPWKLGTAKSSRGQVMVAHGLSVGMPIADVREFVAEHQAVSQANARLIAAAPELLAVAEMVREASELSGVNGPLADAARAAIAKATGQ